MTRTVLFFIMLLCVLTMNDGGRALAQDVVIVKSGVAQVPIVLAPRSSPETVRAANTLAKIIEKISGAKPQVITEAPATTPPSAVWIGVQPAVEPLFAGVKLTFDKPEEVLIAVRGGHVLIAGDDRFVADKQTAFGTANAVYCFIEKQLQVRWLWPGELGEDIIKSDIIALPPMEYRFAPPFRQRGIYRRAGGSLLEWTRAQRIQLDSLDLDGGHGFSKWWEMYHQSNPDYFALQPDGTRNGFPSPTNAKLCETNPRVWAQWLSNVDESIQKDPAQSVFNASANDASNQGICVCDGCRAWDNLQGRRYQMSWRGLSQEYVAMTDRYVTFWNQLAGMLKERHPASDLAVQGLAYGPAKPAPLAVTLADNVIVSYVGHSPTASDSVRETEKQDWLQWAGKAKRLTYRPNVFWYSGGWNGIPTVALANTIEDFRFLAEHGCIGIDMDTVPQYWATQGVQYYLMAQLAWDPLQDGQAVLADYYRRGFGDAAAEIEAYFKLMEQAHDHIIGPSFRHSMGAIRTVLEQCQEAYNPGMLAEAQALLDRADQKLTNATPIYRHRVEFLRTGLDFTRVQMQVIDVMARVRQSSGSDRAAVEQAIALCAQRDELMKRHDGVALNAHHFNITWNRARKMQDFLGPPSPALREGKATDAPPSGQPLAQRSAFNPAPAEQQGWTLALRDDFKRDELGPHWQVVDGAWSVKDGLLVSGGGTLLTTRRFPGLQRLEFEAMSNVRPFPFFGPDTQASLAVSDMSTLLHARDGTLESGYFLQFGGFLNRRNTLKRLGVQVDQSDKLLIVPDKMHRFIAESDGRHVRLIVDDTVVLEYADAAPPMGDEHGKIGFYFYTAANIRNLRIYTKNP